MSSFDQVYPFQISSAAIRGRYAHLDATIKGVLEHHDYPWVIKRLLIELVTVGTLMVTGFKFKGLFTLQASSKGPLRLLVLDVTDTGDVRACAKFDKELVKSTTINGSALTSLMPGGHIAFTIDQDNEKDRYQGLVEITGSNLAECINHYFRQSEQINTTVLTAVPENEAEFESGTVKSGGIMIQQMPIDASEEQEEVEAAWVDAVTKMSTLKPGELLDATKTPEQMLYNLFWEGGVILHEPKQLRSKCRCSLDKVTNMLKQFPEEDIKDMIVDGKLEVVCEFCSKKYDIKPGSV